MLLKMVLWFWVIQQGFTIDFIKTSHIVTKVINNPRSNSTEVVVKIGIPETPRHISQNGKNTEQQILFLYRSEKNK